MLPDPEKPIKIATIEDAERLYAAMQAASLYGDIVQCVPQPNIGEVVDYRADVHMESALYCLEKFNADRFTFAWLVMRGFAGE